MAASTSHKVLPLSQLERIVKTQRRKKKRAVFTNGCFDILHVGHLNYLEDAKRLGDYLIVAVNADKSVRKLKGPKRPINDQRSRARVLAGLACVDFVVIFGTKRVTPLLSRLKPEIYVKGGDYTPESLDAGERAAIDSYRGKIRILPLWKGYSTTKTIKRMSA
jgi:rfaE bifunctional protein nucleotidyltransferase chain/domain